jgi:O-succinylbenzoic acid--CoA ligase
MPVDFLTQRVTATPQREALVDVAADRTYDFQELDDLVDERARRLLALVDSAATEGTDQHWEAPRIATLLAPRPEFVVTFYATMRLGWQLVPLATSVAEPELATRIDRVDPALLVAGGDTAELAQSVEACPVRSVDSAGEITGLDSEEGIADIPQDGDRIEPSYLATDDTVLVMFTSGTTGEPKGVKLTVENLQASATASAYRLGVSPADRWLCCLPLYHMGGFAPVVRTVLAGTTLLVQRSFDAAETASILADWDVTGISLVPTQLDRLLEHEASEWSLDTVLLGGAPAPPVLVDRARAAGVPAYPTYGLTETASQIATALPEEAARYPGTVGQPLLGTEVTILADGTPAEPGEPGEVVVAGPTVTAGYLADEATAAAFSEWGLHTGDVGYRDEAGRLWIEGRQDDLIQTGGELVAPSEVAEAIRSHRPVENAAVVGIDDPEWGERVAALVVAPDEELTEDDVRAHCRQLLAEYKLPKTVAFAREIPRTASGTIDRQAVRDRF